MDQATNWKQNYTPAQQEEIKKHWKDAPPKCCKGKCDLIQTVFYNACNACKWSDDVSIDTLDINNSNY